MASPVLSAQKHTLTFSTSIAASPTDLTFTATTPPEVQMTSPLAGLPSMIVGQTFVVEDHGTHNGRYEVITVTTEFEDYVVESLTGSTNTASPEQADIRITSYSESASLTGSPTTANCVPFATTRVVTYGKSDDSITAYVARLDFTGGDTVRASTSIQDVFEREIVVEATVVEFNPSEVNVYSGVHDWDSFSDEEIFAIGTAVDLSKSFLYFTYSTKQGADIWRQHQIRGRITGTNQLTFDATENQGAGIGDTKVAWYVVEAKNTAWAVDAVDIQIADLASTNTDTFTAVDDGKTFVLGSYKGSDGVVDGDSNADNTIDVTLTDSGGDTWDTVTATRDGTDGIIDWSGFVIELAGNENVYRGTLTTSAASPDPAGHTTISGATTVAEANSMVRSAGSCGHGGSGSHLGTASDDVPDAFCTWAFFGTGDVTQIDCEHNTGGGETGGSVSWEVIEWDVGGAAPPRRVMVVS